MTACLGNPTTEYEKPRAEQLLDTISGLIRQIQQNEWKRITTESLPKVGDEVGNVYGSVFEVDKPMADNLAAHDYFEDGWSHFRTINPPKEA